ncbi:ASCH domain-containing protein [Roseovarius aquimarinus]|uniref:ASCH domain-containing protein n=1 Tax=Roseovarius aquimarinus TaxID=1229156 RepID=A0ABW7I694_9RHOB
MTVTRGLIIADPWIEHILNGRKDWEMRSQATSVRGWIGLIRKGSGTVVGLAYLAQCRKALNQAQMIANHDHHRIPEDMIRRGEVAKWVVPWELSDIIPLDRPVPYEHKAGAVIWVTLEPYVRRQLTRYLDRKPSVAEIVPARTVDKVSALAATPEDATSNDKQNMRDREPMPPLPDGCRKVLGRSVLSGGNIRNNHIKLASLMSAFPRDVIGGSNKAEAAPRRLEIDWGGPETAKTDIDGTKSIFRARGWVRRFFAAAGAHEHDTVVFTETAPYRISVRLQPSKSTM